MLPIIIHIAAVVVITALFIIGYIRQRYLYQLLFAIWAPTTPAQQIKEKTPVSRRAERP